MTQIQNGADNSKKEKIELKMVAEENITLLMQQLVSVRKALAAAEKECNEIRKQLDKEVKFKKLNMKAHKKMNSCCRKA